MFQVPSARNVKERTLSILNIYRISPNYVIACIYYPTNPYIVSKKTLTTIDLFAPTNKQSALNQQPSTQQEWEQIVRRGAVVTHPPKEADKLR